MYIEGNKRDFFEKLLENAKEKQRIAAANYDKWMRQYEGDLTSDVGVDCTTGYNVTYEMVEAIKDTTIPQPAVTPVVRSEKNTRAARSIEQICRRARDELDFEKLNDIDELTTYIAGGDAWLVEWDDNRRTHDIFGNIRVRTVGVKRFFPQPDIPNADAMEYCFVSYNTTKDDLIRAYGISREAAEDADQGTEEDITNIDEVITVYICYYRGENGETCKFAWSGETVLEDITDYYARKVRKCKKCGQLESRCRCEKPKIETINLDYEELEEDVVTTDGTVIPAMIPKMRNGEIVTEKVWVPATDGSGKPIVGDNGLPELVESEQPVMIKNRIKWYKPKSMPVLVRVNVSKPDSAFGQSDCEFIRPIQQELNKVLTRIHEKIMRSGATPVIPPDVTTDRGDDQGEVYEVGNGIFEKYIKLAPGQTKDQFGVINTEVSVQQDLNYAEYLYDKAKRLMGVTESYQGQADTTAKSGAAKQLQIAQAAGRLRTKRTNKQLFYSKLDRAIFELYLAYADEPRPVSYVDEYGETQNLQFNRYDFLIRDEQTGEYYYDDRYMFSIDNNGAVDQDKNTMWTLVMQMYGNGMFGTVGDPNTLIRVWMQLEKYGLPFARENVNYYKQYAQEIRQAQAQAQEQVQMQTQAQAQQTQAQQTPVQGVQKGVV